jgi:hypothetical protein
MIAAAVDLPLDQIGAIIRQCARRFIRVNGETEEPSSVDAAAEEPSAGAADVSTVEENVELILEQPAAGSVKDGFTVPEDHLAGAGGEEVSVMEGVIAGRRGLLSRIKASWPETHNAAPAVKTGAGEPPAPPRGMSAAEKLVLETLERARDQIGTFQGFVIEPVGYGAGEFAARIANMISPPGIVQTLSPTRVLVLFDRDADGELIAHRVTRSVQGRNVFSFGGDEVRETFSLIKSVL